MPYSLKYHDAKPFQDANGRWHWQVFRLAGKTGRSEIYGPVEECCHQHAGKGHCPGFGDKETGEKEGWKRAKELETANAEPV